MTRITMITLLLLTPTCFYASWLLCEMQMYLESAAVGIFAAACFVSFDNLIDRERANRTKRLIKAYRTIAKTKNS